MLGGGKKIGVGAAAPTLLCRQLPGGKHDQVLFLNNGTTTVFLGDGSVTPAYGYPVEPLGTLALPGGNDWYAIAGPAAGATPQVVNVIPGGLAATPSAAQIAVQIAAQNLGVNVQNQPGVNVQNSQIPNRPVLKYANSTAVAVAGTVACGPPPGVGLTYLLYLVWLIVLQNIPAGSGYTGTPGIASATLSDGTRTLFQNVAYSTATAPVVSADFDGFQVGDNKGLNLIAQFPAIVATTGAVTNFAEIGFTYAVGAAQ